MSPRVIGSADQPASDNLRAFMARRSVVIRLTPRQAVEAAHALEGEAARTGHRRLDSAVIAIHAALWEAGWRWDPDEEAWHHPGPPSGTVPDRF